MTDVLRVGVAQMALRPARSVAEYAAHVGRLMEMAAGQGAQLVVLPELATIGLLASHTDCERLAASDMHAAFREVLATLTGEYEAALRDLARAHGVWLLAGSHFRADDAGGYRNTAYMFGPDGALTRQDKLHLTKPELAIATTPGDTVAIVDLGVTKVGIAVCYDVEFPELIRALALRGAEVLLCPSLTYNALGFHRVRYCCHARAIENQLYVVVSTLVGTIGVPCDAPIAGVGRAFVAAPIDRVFRLPDGVLARTTTDDETVLVADLDLDRLRESRARSEVPTLKQWRPDLYGRVAPDVVDRPPRPLVSPG